MLTPEVFTEAAAAARVRLGHSPLNLVNLVWLGIGCAMNVTCSFAFVLTTTLKLLEDQERFYSTACGKEKKKAQQRAGKKGRKGKRSKHHPYQRDPTQVTEEAFTQARQRMPLSFWVALMTLLAQRFEHEHPQHLKFRGLRLLALDGTMLTLPDHEELRKHFGTPKNGQRRRAAPQARMVMFSLPGVRIPIAYEVAQCCESELDLARRLLDHVRSRDLLLMDRGFVSYGFFWQIQQRGAYFGTRLKKDIKYRKLRRLGPQDWLVEWKPKDARRQWTHLPRSIQLRVIPYQIRGFRASAILTNLLDPKCVSRDDWVRLASDCEENGKFQPGLYHRRWEIETMYHELKVTLQLKSLRSRTAASVQYEIAGRVVYYLLIRWLMVRAAEKLGLDPLRLSFRNAVRELELMRGTMIASSPTWVARELLPRLLDRMASHLVPLRPGRHYPRPNDTQIKNKGHGEKQLPAKLNNRINSNHHNQKRKLVQQA
jgi:hypothetical protein